MDQNERLDFLIEQFKEDSIQYRALETPADAAGKKRILRSLMNIRMPKMMPPAVLNIQDEYLQERSRENGIVTLDMIPAISERDSKHAFADKLSVWQGDITRLAVDAIVNAANSQMLGCFVPMHVLFLEIGVGANTPVIIKYPFWQMTNDNKNAVYACLNYNEAVCPVQIEERSIVIDGDSGAVIKQLLYISVFYRESRIDSSMGRGW